MNERFIRTESLLGPAAMQKLADSRVALFGLGGVGGYVLEALVRSGVGALDLFDHDTVDISNLNRQVLALDATVGRLKTDAAAERALAINPDVKLTLHPVFFLPENAEEFDFTLYDYVVDAVDTVTAKLAIIEKAQAAGTPVISCMGTGNKLDPSQLRVADLFETSVCPLAKVMRREARKRGITSLKVVYSREEPTIPASPVSGKAGRPAPGSTAFVPAAAGLLLASEVVRDLIKTVSS